MTEKPNHHPDEATKNLEEQRLRLAKQLELPENTTSEQIDTLGKVREFSGHEEMLRTHFIDHIRIATCQPFSDDMSWSQINEIVEKLMFTLIQKESDEPDGPNLLKMMSAVHPDDYEEIDKKLCKILGLPGGSTEDLTECIQKGINFEK